MTSDEGKKKLSKKERLEESLKTIYVGNISPKTFRKNLQRHFATYGPIKNVRYDKRTNKSMLIENTFAFIVYEDQESATKALQSNGKEMNGNHITVQSQTEYEQRSNNDKCVFIHNLPDNALEEDLVQFFSPHISESMASVKVLRNKFSMKSKNCGYATFASKKDLEVALKMHRKKIGDKR